MTESNITHIQPNDESLHRSGSCGQTFADTEYKVCYTHLIFLCSFLILQKLFYGKPRCQLVILEISGSIPQSLYPLFCDSLRFS